MPSMATNFRWRASSRTREAFSSLRADVDEDATPEVPDGVEELVYGGGESIAAEGVAEKVA